MGSDSFQWCPATGQGAVETNGNAGGEYEEYEEKILYSESERALEQVAHRVYGESPSLEILQPHLETILCNLFQVNLPQ
ncbi:hypothetical protein WISP_104945 [Willisornis vidua]|uniref:Uncharacterized protein n=1 Tax=Willisornis vidua TaxID=1566151 RepID=A0ABQ9D2S2_9PASS|nr:hypothetical protein WISP_104945 [Willisornis vidua]